MQTSAVLCCPPKPGLPASITANYFTVSYFKSVKTEEPEIFFICSKPVNHITHNAIQNPTLAFITVSHVASVLTLHFAHIRTSPTDRCECFSPSPGVTLATSHRGREAFVNHECFMCCTVGFFVFHATRAALHDSQFRYFWLHRANVELEKHLGSNFCPWSDHSSYIYSQWIHTDLINLPGLWGQKSCCLIWAVTFAPVCAR